jgi:hypothetical protein
LVGANCLSVEEELDLLDLMAIVERGRAAMFA